MCDRGVRRSQKMRDVIYEWPLSQFGLSQIKSPSLTFNLKRRSTSNLNRPGYQVTPEGHHENTIPESLPLNLVLTNLVFCFFQLKWSQIKWLYYILMLLTHFIYSITYSVYAVLVFKTLCTPELMVIHKWRHPRRGKEAMHLWQQGIRVWQKGEGVKIYHICVIKFKFTMNFDFLNKL